MHRGCVSCRNWQGNTQSHYALCNYYCSIVEPRLWDMESFLDLKKFCVPFDPHDMKYFYSYPEIMKGLLTSYVPDGVKRVVRKEQDIKMILHNLIGVVGERVVTTPIVYFYTHKDFCCELYKE